MEPQNYPLKDAAQVVGVSVYTITRDVQLGRIKAVRYGRRVLIPRDEIARIASQGMPALKPEVELR